MRVLQIVPTSGPGGAESIVASLSRQLVNTGVEALVASSGHAPHLFTKLESLGIESIRLRSSGLKQLVGEISGLIRETRPSIVHSHMFDANLPSALSGMLCRVPVFLTVHSTVYETESRKRRMVYAALSRLVSGVIAVSNSVASSLVAGGAAAGKVVRIHNGVDVSRFGIRDSGGIRAEFGIPAECRLAGMVANVRPAKDHELVIEAASIVVREFPDFHLILVGDRAGPESPDLMSLASRLGVERHIHFAGLRDDVPDILGALDLFVLASKVEGLPVSVIEAMAAGLPVVASDVGGVSEVVKDGVTGFVVPPGERDALATRVTDIMADGALAARMGDAGRRRAMREFSTESMAKSYISLYEGGPELGTLEAET